LLKKTPGVGTISLTIKDALVIRNQNIQSGDFIQVRSEAYQVIGYFQAYDQPLYDCVRFTKKIKKNANNAPYHIIKQPTLKGNVASIPQYALELQKPVDIKFEKPDKNNYGTVSIGYKNACFNILGFLTHDVAV